MTTPDGKVILPGIGDDENRTLNKLLDDLGKTQERNKLRASYYDGKRAIRQVGTVIPPQYYRLGIVLGWTAKAVDALARRCNLDDFVWPDGDIGSIGHRQVWDGNMLGSESGQGLVESLLHGPAFTVVTKGGPGEPPALIHFKDALNAAGEWDKRARRLRNLLSITERDDDGIKSLALYLHNQTIIGERVGGRWVTVDVQDHAFGMPADMLPYKPRNQRPFGRSRITRPLMGLQDQATRALIRLEGHMDIYSYPELWMLGADESIFKDEAGAIRPTWQVMLGRIKGIPDDENAAQPRADVKQIPASDPAPHLSTLNAIAKMMAREASLPDTALALTDVSNPTSAESYDSSQYELISEAEGAVRDWSPGLRRTYIRALAVANGIPAEDVPREWLSIDTKWRDPRYQSKAAEADAGAKMIGSIPWLAETEVGLELLGLSPQQIRRAMADRDRARMMQAIATLAPRPAEPAQA